MSSKSKGDGIRQKLIDLGKKTGVRHANLETVFLIERLVVRFVSDQELSNRLVFKGGFVGLRVYDSPRYTVDLDAILVKSDIENTLKLTQKKAEIDLDDGVWFRFESQVDLATQGEYGGVRQVYRAGIGEVLKDMKKAQIINFDMGIGDPVTPAPQSEETPSLLSKGEEICWSVYPVETIIAEKLHALVAHGSENSRSKDVHDLAVFLPQANLKTVREAIQKSFKHRETEVPPSFASFLKDLDTVRLKRGWPSAVASIKDARSFEEAFDEVIRWVGKI